MPAPTAPLIGFVLGIAFAWAAADELGRAGSGITSRSLVVVTLFSLLVFAPVSAYFLAFSPDWSYAYFVDSERLPSAVDLGLVLLDAASVPAGFAVAARRAGSRRLGPLVQIAAFPTLAAGVFLLIASPRLAVSARSLMTGMSITIRTPKPTASASSAVSPARKRRRKV